MAEDVRQLPACFSYKHRLAKIVRTAAHRRKFQVMVTNFNAISRNAYAFSKWHITHAIANLLPYMEWNNFMDEKYFMACLQLNIHTNRGIDYALPFRQQLHDSVQLFRFTFNLPNISFPNNRNTCSYEANEMIKNYCNGIILHCGSRLRQYINLRTKEFLTQPFDNDTKNILFAKLCDLKNVVSTEILDKPPQFTDDGDGDIATEFAGLLLEIYGTLRPLLAGRVYANQYHSIDYDMKENPDRYFNLYVKLSLLFEQHGFPLFHAIPLRDAGTSYVMFDQECLIRNVLQRQPTADNVATYKEAIFHTKKKIFRPKKNGDYTFNGMIRTDGYGVTLVFPHKDHKFGMKHNVPKVEDRYIKDHLPVDRNLRLKYLQKKFVYWDPNKRDLIAGVGQSSRKEKGLQKTMRYTQNQRAKEVGFHWHRQQLRRMKTRQIKVIELSLSMTYKKSCLSHEFDRYLAGWYRSLGALSQFYGGQFFLRNRFRRTMNEKRSEARLINNIKTKFGPGCVMIMGNYSNPHNRYHEPVKGKGLRDLFRRHFDTYLIDEYCTSKYCPECGAECETFKNVPNPRPYRRATQRFTRCHGQLRCTNRCCLTGQLVFDATGEPVYRYWNRDLSAGLNMINITDHVFDNGTRPPLFTRGQQNQQQ